MVAPVHDGLIEVADGFWNIRGSFKVLGMLDLGTQSSLVRLQSGRFVLLDCVPLGPGVDEEIRRLTDDGRKLYISSTNKTYRRSFKPRPGAYARFLANQSFHYVTSFNNLKADHKYE